MLRRILFGVSIPAMALGAVLLSTSASLAQGHGGGGHGSGGHGGGGHGANWGGGYGGGGGWGRGAVGFGLGYGLGRYGGFGYGYPSYYGGGGYGYPSYGYGDSGYAPSYGYNNYYSLGVPAYSTYPSDQQPYGTVVQPGMADYSSAYGLDNGALASAQATQNQNACLIELRVPANAQVWFNGQATRQTGSQREFVSPPLQPGQEYTYTIRARWMQNGQPVDQTRALQVAATERHTVNFMAASNQRGANVPPASFDNGAPPTNLEKGTPPANVNPNWNVAPTTQPVRNPDQLRAAPPSRRANPDAQQNQAPRHNPVP